MVGVNLYKPSVSLALSCPLRCIGIDDFLVTILDNLNHVTEKEVKYFNMYIHFVCHVNFQSDQRANSSHQECRLLICVKETLKIISFKNVITTLHEVSSVFVERQTGFLSQFSIPCSPKHQ